MITVPILAVTTAAMASHFFSHAGIAAKLASRFCRQSVHLNRAEAGVEEARFAINPGVLAGNVRPLAAGGPNFSVQSITRRLNFHRATGALYITADDATSLEVEPIGAFASNNRSPS